MKVNEILREMAVRRKKAEQIFSGLEPEFNLHVLKLLGFRSSDTTRSHWKKELRSWASRLSILSLKDDNRPVPAKDIFKWMYDEPFGGREVQNVESLLQYLSEDYERNAVPAADISAQLKAFHQKLAESISAHNPGHDLINAL